MSKLFDCIIIGGGVTGCSIARYLSRYEGKFLVIERHNDVGDETSNANSAIVHSGYDPKPGTLKAKFNVLGNKMMPQVCKELDVPFDQCGSLTVALNEEEVGTLKMLLDRAKTNGVEAKFLTKEETIAIEPNINPNIYGSLLCPTAGIISPFNLTVNFMENAMDNGVELALNTEIVEIKKEDKIYHLKDQHGNVYDAKFVVNATGVNSEVVTRYLEEPSFKINPTKGEYILLDHFDPSWVKHTLFMCPSKVGKGVLVSPTTSRNYIVGPSATPCEIEDTACATETFAFLREKAKSLVENIPYYETIKGFAGVRANNDHDDFIIEESDKNEGFMLVCGIMSPGLASSPAIGDYVSEYVSKRLGLKENPKYNPTIRPHKTLAKVGPDEYRQLVKEDPRYGIYVCRCEKVTEAEIVDVINRNCGATTVKGVRKRTRAGFGKCQGTFCQPRVVDILARELKKDRKEILFSDDGSNILIKDSKEGK